MKPELNSKVFLNDAWFHIIQRSSLSKPKFAAKCIVRLGNFDLKHNPSKINMSLYIRPYRHFYTSDIKINSRVKNKREITLDFLSTLQL